GGLRRAAPCRLRHGEYDKRVAKAYTGDATARVSVGLGRSGPRRAACGLLYLLALTRWWTIRLPDRATWRTSRFPAAWPGPRPVGAGTRAHAGACRRVGAGRDLYRTSRRPSAVHVGGVPRDRDDRPLQPRRSAARVACQPARITCGLRPSCILS